MEKNNSPDEGYGSEKERKEDDVQNSNGRFSAEVLPLSVLGMASVLIHYTLSLHFIRMSSFFLLLMATSLPQCLAGLLVNKHSINPD